MVPKEKAKSTSAITTVLSVKRILLITCGYASLFLGVVGIILPLLPTTPFLLLASICFVRSSDSLHHWLIRHRLFGSYIHAYERFKAVSKRAKAFALFLLWVGISYSVFFVISLWLIRTPILLIAIGVTIHILRLKTLTREMVEELKQECAGNPA